MEPDGYTKIHALTSRSGRGEKEEREKEEKKKREDISVLSN